MNVLTANGVNDLMSKGLPMCANEDTWNLNGQASRDWIQATYSGLATKVVPDLNTVNSLADGSCAALLLGRHDLARYQLDPATCAAASSFVEVEYQFQASAGWVVKGTHNPCVRRALSYAITTMKQSGQLDAAIRQMQASHVCSQRRRQLDEAPADDAAETDDAARRLSSTRLTRESSAQRQRRMSAPVTGRRLRGSGSGSVGASASGGGDDMRVMGVKDMSGLFYMWAIVAVMCVVGNELQELYCRKMAAKLTEAEGSTVADATTAEGITDKPSRIEETVSLHQLRSELARMEARILASGQKTGPRSAGANGSVNGLHYSHEADGSVNKLNRSQSTRVRVRRRVDEDAAKLELVHLNPNREATPTHVATAESAAAGGVAVAMVARAVSAQEM